MDSDVVPADRDCAGRAGPGSGADGPAAAVRPVAAGGAPAPPLGCRATVFQTGLSVLNCVPLSQTAAAQAQPSQSGGSLRPGRSLPVRRRGGGTPSPPARRPRRTPAPAGAADWRGVLTAGVAGRRGGAGRRPAGATCAFICACGWMRRSPPPFRGVAVPVYVARAALPLPVRLPRPAVYLTRRRRAGLLGVLRHEPHRRPATTSGRCCGRRPGPLHWVQPWSGWPPFCPGGTGSWPRRGGPFRGRTTGSGRPTAIL